MSGSKTLNAPVPDADGTGVVNGPNDEGWELEEDETPIRLAFDTIGDRYSGAYLGMVTITPPDDEPFEQAGFRDAEGPKIINPGSRLRDALKRIDIGREVLMVYVKDVDTGKQSPMRDFKVYSRKLRPEWQHELTGWVTAFEANARRNVED